MTSNDEELKLSFLLSGSCDLPSSCIKLRSYLNIHLANVADENNLKLLSFRNRNKTCPYCYSSWSAKTTSFKLLPEKKFTPSKEDKTAKETTNTLVLKCRVCTKKSLFSLVKRKKVKDQPQKEEIVKKKIKTPNTSKKGLSPETLVKKKKKVDNSQAINKQFEYRSPLASQSKPLKNSNKNLVPNPFSVQMQNKFSKKKDRQFKRLKQAIKQNQATVKKSLKDFLSLV